MFVVEGLLMSVIILEVICALNRKCLTTECEFFFIHFIAVCHLLDKFNEFFFCYRIVRANLLLELFYEILIAGLTFFLTF